MSLLEELGVCKTGQVWADSQENYRDAWELCERGDWMLWIAVNQNVDLRKLTAAKLSCAKTVEHLMKNDRSIKALKVAQYFIEGRATKDDLDAYAAFGCYNDYADAVAVSVITVHGPYHSSTANFVAAAVGDDWGYDEEIRKETLKNCADLVRQHISFDDLKIGL